MSVEETPKEQHTVKNFRPICREALEEADISFTWHVNSFKVEEPLSEDALQSLRKRTQEIMEEEAEMRARRPIYIKVHRKYMSTITLDTFRLPWVFDPYVSHIPG